MDSIKVSIIMGSTSDLPVMEAAMRVLEDFEISFEVRVLSAHRCIEDTLEYVRKATSEGSKVMIAGAGGAAHLPGVIAAATHVPVVGVPIKASISMEGWDSVLSILQMPGGIPVATVGLNNAKNAGLLAVQILALSNASLQEKLLAYKKDMREKVLATNQQLDSLNYKYKC